MREILFRGKRIDNGEWITGVFEPDLVFKDTIGQYSGLMDKNGKKIFEGDILCFDDEEGIWCAPVVFTRGLFGLDTCSPKQIKNPPGWDKPYDCVNARRWGCKWGYEEFGTAYTYRQPLAIATLCRDNEYFKRHEEFGWDNYFVDAEVIGNIYENEMSEL